MRIRIKKGDISKIRSDAIVLSALPDCKMRGNIMIRVKRAGGQIIEDEAVKSSPLKPGEFTSTASGDLPCGEVIHAVLSNKRTESLIEDIFNITEKVLNYAKRNEIKTIAFTALGVESFRISVGEMARALVEAIRIHPDADYFDEIILVDDSDEVIEAFEKEVRATKWLFMDLTTKTETWLEEIRFNNFHRIHFKRENGALIVIDMQNYFTNPKGKSYFPQAQYIIENINKIIELCRANNVPVIFTQHCYKNPKEEAGMLYRWWRDSVISGTRDAAIDSNIKLAEHDKIIKKQRYSAFFNTSLNDYLKELNIADLIITGVMSNLCCETTARDAFMYDYRVLFVADATATSDEEMHLATLRNLAYGFAYVLKTEDLLKMLKGE